VAFLKAALGFEPEVMREGEVLIIRPVLPWLIKMSGTASERLVDAENTAWHDQRNAQRDSHSYRSTIYPPGSEFALCNAEAQMMGAVIGVLNESLTESIKAFYKLRKAYMTLHSIVEAEGRYLRGKDYSDVLARHSLELGEDLPSNEKHDVSTSHTFGDSVLPTSNPSVTRIGKTTKSPIDPRIELKGYGGKLSSTNEADENKPPSMVGTGTVQVGLPEENLEKLSLKSASNVTKAPPSRSHTPTSDITPVERDITAEVSGHAIDEFIHSGTNLCFGLMLLLISMIPPAFGKLLYVIGVGGDREKGLRMLWQATKFKNINGAMAGLFLLGYYNGIAGFSDILPDQQGDLADCSMGRRQELLAQMRSRYPTSQLWLLEAARMEASCCRLETALEMLSMENESPMKQVAALTMFERSLDSMYLHRYGDTADFFMKVLFLP
jgi:hypothetical protein